MSDIQFPEWDTNDKQSSIAKLFHCVVAHAREQIKWYDERRKPKRLCAQAVRGLALFLATLGALCPLVTPVLDEYWKSQLPTLGYVFLAIGAALVGFDRLYGFSSSWMRFTSTQLSLEMLLKEFQFDWLLMQSQPFSETTSIQKLKDFASKLDGIVKQETDAWITDFKSNIAELEKMLKTGADERKPGAIKLTITNAKSFKVFSIYVDGAFNKKIDGVTEALLDMVSPGRHEVSISAVDMAGNEQKETKVVEVAANTIASVEIVLR
ncbi:MAG: SLATT domain-containing protein [Geobacteraceae bacterium]|nr:SLATT domain-containing protein [Geobacteraceae bacterium]